LRQLAHGEKLPDEWELEVESALELAPSWVPSTDLGRARRLEDARGRYIEFCKATFANDLSLRGLKIVVDSAHGAAYQVAPEVFHELGAEVIRIGGAPNGLNINDGVGATHPKALIEAVKAHNADYGIALDGDADRLQLIDRAGRLFNGDELLYVLVADRLERGQAVPGAVGTLMTNMAVELALQDRGVSFVRAKVGDRYVLEELICRGWQLGGEGSGHLLALDKHSTGDGIVSSLLVLQAVMRSGKTLAELLAEVYIRMTRGQGSLVIDASEGGDGPTLELGSQDLSSFALPLVAVADAELAAHAQVMKSIDKTGEVLALWEKAMA